MSTYDIQPVIRRLEELGWTQAKLDRHIGVSRGMVSHWKKGTRVPSEESRQKLDAFLADEPLVDEGKNGPDPPDPPPEAGAYTLEHARKDLFLSAAEIESLVNLLKRKRNLVLQGPPGTGKTLRGAASRMAADRGAVDRPHRGRSVPPVLRIRGLRSRVPAHRHRRFRPTGRAISAFLRSRPRGTGSPGMLLVIDEINRGNLSRIFGELLMLIEADKRDPAWAVRTAYARPTEPAFHVLANLHLVGTMNTADRSLALVDYALRRRFAFSTVEPAFGSKGFDRHLADDGVPEPIRRRITARIEALNKQIREHPQLGEGFPDRSQLLLPAAGGLGRRRRLERLVHGCGPLRDRTAAP